MELQMQGVIVPPFTPFNRADQNIDQAAIQNHIEWLLEKGVNGLMPCGTTGEGPLLSHSERMRVLQLTVDQVSGRIPVVAHVGAPGTAETIVLAKDAWKRGADALSVVTPYFYTIPDHALVTHFVTVARSVPAAPIYLYNIPQNTGNAISAAVAAAILERAPNVLGIKDSSGDLDNLFSYLPLADGRFQVICGSDSLVESAICGGAVACVSGNANVFPELLVSLVDAVRAGDWTVAQVIQSTLDVVREAMGDGGNISLMKQVLAHRGIEVGAVRPPLAEASPADLERSISRLTSLGFIQR